MKSAIEFWHNPPCFASDEEWSIARCRENLSTISGWDLGAKLYGSSVEDLARIAIARSVYRLGRLGVAPRWSGVIRFARSNDYFSGCPGHKAIVGQDAGLYDVLWLHAAFNGTGHKASLSDWRGLFDNPELDWGLVLDILKHRATGSQKAQLLGFGDDWRCAGNLVLLPTPLRRRIRGLSKLISSDVERESQRLERDRKGGGIKIEEVRERAERNARKMFAARLVSGEGPLARFSQWTSGAKVFAWMTGGRVWRADFRRTLHTEWWGVGMQCKSDVRMQCSGSKYTDFKGKGVVDCYASPTPSETIQGVYTPVSARAWIGFDPGRSGGMAAIFERPDGQGGVSVTHEAIDIPRGKDGMPHDAVALREILERWVSSADVVRVAFESQHRRPNDSVDGWSKLTASITTVRSVLSLMGLQGEEVSPQRWKRALGLTRKSQFEFTHENKKRSQTMAESLYPEPFVAGVGRRHDLAEALLIAHWCRLQDAGTAVAAV